MAPIYEYLCGDCGHRFEELVADKNDEIPCPHCETYTTERLFPLIGGYQGNMGGASTRPRQAGSFKTKKVQS